VAKVLTAPVALPPSDSLRALDRLNFFLAALQSGFGPFVARWSRARASWSRWQL
jgi:hypothetical protein